MPRYAILEHDHPAPHWDLFLESGPALRSWRLPEKLRPGVAARAEPAPDHRLMYLDYEGPVSGNRGTVSRIDAGTFSWEEDSPDRVAVHLTGGQFIGRMTLTRTDGAWVARFDPDPVGRS